MVCKECKVSRGEERRQAREGESDMRKFYYIFGAVAAIGIAVVGYNVSASVFGSAVSAPIDLDFEDDEALIALAQGMTKGDPDATITIVEFGDYQCPACGGFALTVKPQIEATFVASGRAKFVFYDFPLVDLHPNAFLAARASRCAADQDMYWEYHETLFRNQSRWSSATSPAGGFEDYAGDLGMDEDTFGACLNSDKHADVVSANMRLGRRLGISGTPSILIDANGVRRRVPSNDYRSIALAVEAVSPESSGN